MKSCSDWNKELEEIAEGFPSIDEAPQGRRGLFHAGANPRGGAGGVACAGFRRFAGTCGARPPRARRRCNMGSAGTKRRDEEETWRLDLSGA